MRHHESRFDARDIECLRSDGPDAAGAAGLHERIPDPQRVIGRHPHLVAQVSGEARARHHERRLRRATKYPISNGLRRSMPARPAFFSTAQDVGPCTASAAISSVVSLISTSNPTAESSSQSSCRSAVHSRYSPSPMPKHRAVVEHVPGIIAPHDISHAVGLELGDIASDQAVEIAHGVRAGDPVLHHRRQIVERRGIADREVFLLDRGEHIHRAVSGPRDEAVDLAQCPRALMERRPQQRLAEVGRIRHLGRLQDLPGGIQAGGADHATARMTTRAA